MKKFNRDMKRALKRAGYTDIEIVYGNVGHPKLIVKLPDGREGKFSMSCTPREVNQAVKNALRQVEQWDKSGVPNIRNFP